MREYLSLRRADSSSYTAGNIATAIGHFFKYLMMRPSINKIEPSPSSVEYGQYSVWKKAIEDTLSEVKVVMKSCYANCYEESQVSKNIDLQINAEQRAEFENAVKGIPNHEYFKETIDIAKGIDLSVPNIEQINPEHYDRCLEVLGIVFLTSGGMRPECLSLHCKKSEARLSENIRLNGNRPLYLTRRINFSVVSSDSEILNCSRSVSTFDLQLPQRAAAVESTQTERP